MKQFKVMILILIGILLAITTISCLPKAQTIKDNDMKYIFAPEDIKGLENHQYKIKRNKDGKTYAFFKNVDSSNNFCCSYGKNLVFNGTDEVSFTNVINITSNIEDARRLYKTDIKVPKAFVRSGNIDANPKDYGVDEIIIAESKDTFILVLRKSKLVYEIQIYGIAIKAEQVRDGVTEKINYISENGIDDYKI